MLMRVGTKLKLFLYSRPRLREEATNPHLPNVDFPLLSYAGLTLDKLQFRVPWSV